MSERDRLRDAVAKLEKKIDRQFEMENQLIDENTRLKTEVDELKEKLNKVFKDNPASIVAEQQFEISSLKATQDKLVEAIREVLSNVTMPDKYVKCCREALIAWEEK